AGAASRTRAWWAFLPPTIMLSIVSFSLLLLQSSLDEVFNPRLRRGKAKRKGVALQPTTSPPPRAPAGAPPPPPPAPRAPHHTKKPVRLRHWRLRSPRPREAADDPVAQ